MVLKHEDVIEIILENSLFRNELIENKSFIALKKNDEVYNIPTYYQHIISELRKVGDMHSKIRSPEYIKKSNEAVNKQNLPKSNTKGKIPILTITEFIGNQEDNLLEYAKHTQNLIKTASETNDGIIIDLRNNGGGNMEPMIVGLGPLYDTSLLGYFKYKAGNLDSWGYKNGKYIYNDEIDWGLESPFVITKPMKVAILLNTTTASSAEITAISFIGNKNTKSFGEKTRGLTTSNSGYNIEDGWKLYLATTSTLSRNKIEFRTSIIPDKKTSNPVKEAIMWLSQA